MRLILISGKAEAGKTTTAYILKEKLEKQGFKAAVVSYGQYVKDTAKMLWDWDGKKDEKGRALLQWWGTEAVRTQNRNFWVETLVRLAKVANRYLDYMIVDDCRFPNELTYWVNSYVFTTDLSERLFDDILTVRVERPGYENKLTPEQRNHISETALDEWIFDEYISAVDRTELEMEVCSKLMPRI